MGHLVELRKLDSGPLQDREVVCAIINGSKLRLDPDLWAVDLNNIGQGGSEDLINNQYGYHAQPRDLDI
jgi:hypothetical protein